MVGIKRGPAWTCCCMTQIKIIALIRRSFTKSRWAGGNIHAGWKILDKTSPAKRRGSSLSWRDFPEEEILRLVACRAGMTDPSDQLNGFEACDRRNSAFLPTFTFYTPYERTTVPASQQFTRYWWRFRTYNGVQYSGWTGWSSFYRSF